MNIRKLQRLVEESPLNKVQIAEKSGLTRVTLDNALQGADVKVSTVEALSKVLGVSTASLFLEDNDEQPFNKDVEFYKQEVARLQSLLDKQVTTKVVVELDVSQDEFVRMGLKDKVIQVLNKK